MFAYMLCENRFAVDRCRVCGHIPSLAHMKGPGIDGEWYTYISMCGKTTSEFDGTVAEAIERWNEECGRKGGCNDRL